MDKQENISQIHLDAINEIGNIGAGNAAASLSQMLNKKIEMDVPETKFVPIQHFSEEFGGPESIVVTIYSPILGDLSGETLFIFSRECALGLVDLMMGNEVGQTTVMDELSESAFKEMANIFIGSYLNAISNMMNVRALPGVPVVNSDMVQAILDNILMKTSEYADNVLCNKANISINGQSVVGDFLFLFDIDTMKTLLDRLNNKYSREIKQDSNDK